MPLDGGKGSFSGGGPRFPKKLTPAVTLTPRAWGTLLRPARGELKMGENDTCRPALVLDAVVAAHGALPVAYTSWLLLAAPTKEVTARCIEVAGWQLGRSW